MPSSNGEEALVWAVGDGADGGPAARAVARRVSAGPVDRFLYLGDVYGRGTAEEFARHYAPTYGRLAEITAPTPGNHEWPNRAQGYDPYWAAVRGQPPPPYYAFELAGWQILSLNSEEPCGRGSPQHRWLLSQVREHGTARLAFWHRARFSAGNHGDQTDVAPLWEALRGRATIVVCGHDHNLQRLKPIDGITQFVSGAGGRGHYPLARSWRRLLPASPRPQAPGPTACLRRRSRVRRPAARALAWHRALRLRGDRRAGAGRRQPYLPPAGP